jgi:cytochrome P450
MESTPSPATPLTDDWCRDHFDHFSPELAADFPAVFSRMRSLCPVAHSDQYGGFWVVSKYDDVFRVAQDWDTFSSAYGLTVPIAPIAVRNLPVEVDPPIQRVYKRLINPYFSPAAILPWEENTRQLVTRMLDAFIERGYCDFMAEFARPYPALSFFDIALSAPPEDIDRVAYMASKSSLPNDPEAGECWIGLSEWISEFVASRRQQPRRHDVVDGVLHAEIEGRPITDEEIIGIIQLLILGGLETTAGALGMMMVRFCEQPEIVAMLRHQPERIPDAIEEMLRLDPPFIQVGRTALRDAEVAGRQIKKGDKVLMYWASAGRDEDQFSDADDFSLERPHNRHMAFGLGPHRCAGSNLARMNMRVALNEIVQRFDDIKLQEGAEIHYHSTTTRAPLAVPISFTPGRPLGVAAA